MLGVDGAGRQESGLEEWSWSDSDLEVYGRAIPGIF
jgi:hypothetical protein